MITKRKQNAKNKQKLEGFGFFPPHKVCVRVHLRRAVFTWNHKQSQRICVWVSVCMVQSRCTKIEFEMPSTFTFRVIAIIIHLVVFVYLRNRLTNRKLEHHFTVAVFFLPHSHSYNRIYTYKDTYTKIILLLARNTHTHTPLEMVGMTCVSDAIRIFFFSWLNNHLQFVHSWILLPNVVLHRLFALFSVYFYRFLLLSAVAECVDTLITLMALPIYIHLVAFGYKLPWNTNRWHYIPQKLHHLIDTLERKNGDRFCNCNTWTFSLNVMPTR